MRKALLGVTGIWAVVAGIPTVEWLINGYSRQRLAGTLSFVAVLATALSVLRLVWPTVVARLKDKVLVAQLRAERDALRAGARTSTLRTPAAVRLFTAGSATTALLGLAVNASVVVLAFLLIGTQTRLTNENFLLCMFAAGGPTVMLAILWWTHEVTRLQRQVNEAELTATLRTLDPAAIQPFVSSVDVGAVAQVTVTAAQVPPPLPTGLPVVDVPDASDDIVDVPGHDVQGEERASTEKPATVQPRWRIRTMLVAAVVVIAAVAILGRLKGPLVFGHGIGLVLGAAVASLPFAGILLVLARKLSKRPWTFGGAYSTHLAGALVGMAPLFAADGFLAVSAFYPYEYRIGWVVLTSVIPPVVWARAPMADGKSLGLKWAVVAAVVIAPLGFAWGFAYARVFTS